MPNFSVYSEGLCFASVCTSLTNEEAAARMLPAGTDRGWRVSTEDFRDGTPNGSPCPQQPETHRHLLFDC